MADTLKPASVLDATICSQNGCEGWGCSNCEPRIHFPASPLEEDLRRARALKQEGTPIGAPKKGEFDPEPWEVNAREPEAMSMGKLNNVVRALREQLHVKQLCIQELESQALLRARLNEKDTEILSALQQLLGVLDTPIARRKLGDGEFINESLQFARAIYEKCK